MEEKVNQNEYDLPESYSENLLSEEGDTKPEADTEQSPYLLIKFNKELIELDKEKATTLAQKGMKFDLISEEYEKLKALSHRSGKDVSLYLSSLEAEASEDKKDGYISSQMKAVTTEFPEISSLDMLPEEVKTAAEIKGTGLLFEYLLFEHRLQKAKTEEEKNRAFAALSSTGSLSSDDRTDPTAAEFLRGVWGR